MKQLVKKWVKQMGKKLPSKKVFNPAGGKTNGKSKN